MTPALTDAEREAIELVARDAGAHSAGSKRWVMLGYAAALAAQAQRIAELERENATLAEVHAEEFDRAENAEAALRQAADVLSGCRLMASNCGEYSLLAQINAAIAAAPAAAPGEKD